MEDTGARTRWQRFWQFVQEFMPAEDEEEPGDGQEAVAPAPVQHHAQDVEATVLPASGVPDSADEPQDIPDPEPSEEETPPMPPTPTVKARVDALITNERTIWTELDRPDLEQLPESVLIRMEHQPLPSLPTVQSGPRTLAEVLTDLKPEDRDALEDAIVNQQERKEQLLGVLLANKQNPFSREELQVMKIKRLEQLVVMSGDPLPGQPQPLASANYNGRRMPHLRIVTQEGEDDNTPPPLMDTMSLIVAKQKERGVRF